MQSMLISALVVFVAVSGTARGVDDCPKSIFLGTVCCDMRAVFDLNGFKNDTMVKCRQTMFKKENRPRTSSEIRKFYACFAECMSSEENLLTDGKIDKAAITKFFTPQNPTFRPAAYTTIEKCFSSYEAEVDSSLECKSGLAEFTACFARETFLNCPSAQWSVSSKCEQLKANVSKCPEVPVQMGIVMQFIP